MSYFVRATSFVGSFFLSAFGIWKGAELLLLGAKGQFTLLNSFSAPLNFLLSLAPGAIVCSLAFSIPIYWIYKNVHVNQIKKKSVNKKKSVDKKESVDKNADQEFESKFTFWISMLSFLGIILAVIYILLFS